MLSQLSLIARLLTLLQFPVTTSENGKIEKLRNNVSRSNELPSADVPEPSQPIPIGKFAHWRARKEMEDQVQKMPYRYTVDGKEIVYELNEFGEPMPIVPQIAQPQDTVRRNTRAPGACKWNAITGSWTYVDQDSSRGTWGYFKDKRKLIRQSPHDDTSDRVAFAARELVPAANTLTANSKELRFRRRPPAYAVHRRDNSGVSMERKETGMNVNAICLDELRRLAAENETAIDSYRSSINELTIWKVGNECRPGARH